jgi:hypothetical protein
VSTGEERRESSGIFADIEVNRLAVLVVGAGRGLAAPFLVALERA